MNISDWSKRIEHWVAMAAPVTMEEEERMLGGGEDREREAKKVKILIPRWINAHQTDISKCSERSGRAKREHSCGCCCCFYGSSCLCCSWTQGANLDFHFVIFLISLFLVVFSPRFSWPIPHQTSRLCLFHRKSTVQLPTQAMDTFHATGSYKNQTFKIFGLGSFRHQLGANFQLMWRGCSVPTIQERTENRFFQSKFSIISLHSSVQFQVQYNFPISSVQFQWSHSSRTKFRWGRRRTVMAN